MNEILQHIVVFSAIGYAVYFLGKKFFYKPKKSKDKGCGSGSCGCS